MPEENFEQQARDKLASFTKEPGTAVWERVQAAIAPPKRKRRVLFWWLLPLFLAGGTVVLLMNRNKFLHQHIRLVTQINTEENEAKNKENDVLMNSDTSLQNQHKNNDKKSGEEQEAFQKNKDIISTKNDYHSTNKKPNYSPDPVLLVKEEKGSSAKGDNVIDSAQNFVQPISNVVPPSSVIPLQNEAATLVDTSKQNIIAAIKPQDSLPKKTDTTTASVTKKKQKIKRYHLGVMAETGMATWGSNLFYGNSTYNVPGVASQGTASNFNNRTSTINSNVKKGIDAGIGVSLQTTVSNKLFFSASLAYRYQQFAVAKTVFLDTSTFSTTGVIYHTNETEQLHFANLYTGIGWQFFKRKKTAVSFQTGLDNSFLFSIKAKQNAQVPPQLNLLKSLAISEVQRWQPNFNASLSIDFYNNQKSHFQISPFARFGLRMFQKAGDVYHNNHLVSAGIGITYFFK